MPRAMCCWAQWSQFQMCTSVPQIDDFTIRISTSLGPISGTGTSCIHSPTSGRALTSARIVAGICSFMR